MAGNATFTIVPSRTIISCAEHTSSSASQRLRARTHPFADFELIRLPFPRIPPLPFLPHRSLGITGKVSELEEWTDMSFPESGARRPQRPTTREYRPEAE